MNYKRFSRFFCLAAACCVILAGAVAPLTAYAAEDDGSAALDVAQETRTLSGTWRWNDEIDFSAFSSSVTIPLEFTVFPDFQLDSESGLIVELNVPAYFEVLALNPADPSSSDPSSSIIYGGSFFAFVYWIPSVVPPDTSPDELQYMGWNAFAGLTSLSPDEVEYSNIDVLFGWGQTITFSRPQEVPVEFYDWFTANAVKQVSPMETFLDNFTAPISGIWSVVTDVSNTIVSTPLLLLAFCFAFLGMCVSIFGRILSRS